MSVIAVVLCTVPRDKAATLADTLLDEGLIACANLIGPFESRYRWRGAIETGQEMLLLMKTRRDLTSRLRARIVELHEYEVPEVLEIAADGLPAYLQWVATACRGEGSA